MKFASKYLSIYLYICLISTSFISSIIEIPLYPLKVKGIPKYENISMIEQYYPTSDNESILFVEEGNTFINRDILFIAKIKLGSEGQPFNLLLDTGSSILWVARNGCGGKHTITNEFNPATSSTSQNTGITFSLNYGSGSCSGFYYNDNIEYIKSKSFNMNFGVADTAKFTVDQCDGIIGLAKKYADNRLSFIHMLKEYKNTDSLLFSIKFETDIIKTNFEGTMYIGKHDDFSKSETISIPMVFYSREIFWACTLSSFGLNNTGNYIHSDYEINILFDTGTNSILLPLKYLQDIQKDLPKYNCYIIQSDSGYQIRSTSTSNLPDLVFKFGRHTLTIPGRYGFYSSNKGIISFATFQNSAPFIMGSPFFFVFHTLFDADSNELKVYPLKNGIKSGLSIVAIIFIAIGSIVLIVGIILLIYYLVNKYRQRKTRNIPVEDLRTDYFEKLYKN